MAIGGLLFGVIAFLWLLQAQGWWADRKDWDNISKREAARRSRMTPKQIKEREDELEFQSLFGKD